jgi:broad specificity phosphatase PhoE
MTRIILVRHGETDWNKEQIFRGTPQGCNRQRQPVKPSVGKK